jgi:hypothetical protein
MKQAKRAAPLNRLAEDRMYYPAEKVVVGLVGGPADAQLGSPMGLFPLWWRAQPPQHATANRLEKLKGNLKDFYSIRINDQWRVIFRWANGEAHDVRITDYH